MAPPNYKPEGGQSVINASNADQVIPLIDPTGENLDGFIVKQPDGSSIFKDSNGKVMAKMIAAETMAHHQLKLSDGYGMERLTFQEVLTSEQMRWNAYNPGGELKYTVCKNHMVPDKATIDLKVIMGKGKKDTGHKAIEYMVKGSTLSRAFNVYEGDSPTEIARVFPDKSDLNKLLVKIDPNKGNDCEYFREMVFSVAGIVDATEHGFIVKQLDGSFILKDSNGNVMAKMIADDTTAHRQLKLFNELGRKLLTLREKIMSAHGRWYVYNPDGKLVYTVCKNNMIQDKAKINLKVTMKKEKEDTGHKAIEYKVKGSTLSGTFNVYEGDSSTEIAQVVQDASDVNKFLVKIDPNKGNDCEYFREIVFSIAGIVDAVKSPSRAKVVAVKLGIGALKVAATAVGGSCVGMAIQG